MKGRKIYNLNALHHAARERRAICAINGIQWVGHQGYIPASFVFNMNAACVHYWIKQGMYLYKPKKKK